MGAPTQRLRDWPRWALPLVLTAALLLAACGGGSDSPSDSGSDATSTPTPPATDDASGDDAASPTASPEATDSPEPTATASPEPTAPPALAITSPAFAEGGQVPIRYTCDGANVLPPLVFTNLPAETATLAVVIDDPDAPGGTWDHWIRFNIEPTDGLAERAASTVDVGEVGTAGTNSFGNLLYGGPCPPDGSHRYFFKLFAVDGELTLAEGATSAELTAALEGRVLATAELMARFERPPALAAPAGLDTTPVIGRISNAYKVLASGERVTFEFDELPFEPGSVEAHWYQSGDRYVVVYRGINAATIGPLCPGNSIQTATGFLHISNAPNEDGGCIASVPPAPAGAGVRACGEHLVYVTAIPTSVAGNLFGTVEGFGDDDALIGVTSAAQANAAITPAIDLEAFCGS